MKKLFVLLCYVFSIACFGATDNKEGSIYGGGGTNENIVPQETKVGWFFGGGIGYGNETFIDSKLGRRNSFYSVAASAKIGGYYYFSRSFGLRYYYSYDVSFNPKLKQAGDKIVSINDIRTSSIFKYHTFNIDAIFNAYSSDKMDIALIGGMGAGLRTGKITPRRDNAYLPAGISGGAGYYPFFIEDPIVRINAGIRTLLNQKYGIELLANVPLNGSLILETSRVKISLAQSYSFTLNFVMEL